MCLPVEGTAVVRPVESLGTRLRSSCFEHRNRVGNHLSLLIAEFYKKGD
jgi:hypothetical protein